jgi:hypothetical protein
VKPPPPKKRGAPPSAKSVAHKTGPKEPRSGSKPPPGAKDQLPPFQYIGDLLAEDLPEPPVLVEGVLHQGELMMAGGTAKSRKTWTFIDMAICVATGNPWWDFPTTQGLVVYLDFELQRWAFSKRVNDVLEAKDDDGLDYSGLDRQLIHWPLRGKVIDLDTHVVNELVRRLGPLKPALIVFDPIYRTLGGRNENDASDIGELMNLLQRLAKDTGAAVVLGHHFSKGNQAEKDAIDRLSGSGVWGRFADTLFIMTQHEDFDLDGALTVNVITRSFPAPDKFVVHPKNYALMVKDTNGRDPNKLKRPGAALKFRDEDIIAPLKDGAALSKQDWFQAVNEKTGISRAGFNNRTADLAARNVVTQVGHKRTDPWALAP